LLNYFYDYYAITLDDFSMIFQAIQVGKLWNIDPIDDSGDPGETST
jgi:hypothetical protein